MTDIIEFYVKRAKTPFIRIESSVIPTCGSFINILRQTWQVNAVTYALDFVDAKFDQPRMRANVELSRRKDLDP